MRTRRRAPIPGTGAAGGYPGKGLLGTSALFLTGGLAAEVGAYAFLAEEVAPVVARVAGQAYRVGRPAVEAYARRAAKGALVRMGVDAGFQFGTGYLAADPAQGNKFLQAWNGINGTSVVAAGALDTGGLRTKAKFLVALGSATTTNFFTVSGGNDDEYGGYWHTADLGDGKQRIDFLRNVVLGLLFDQTKEYGSEWVAKKMAGRAEAWAAQVSGRASKAMLNWMTETRVAMPTSFVVGGVLEVLKKRWENSQKEG